MPEVAGVILVWKSLGLLTAYVTQTYDEPGHLGNMLSFNDSYVDLPYVFNRHSAIVTCAA